MLGGLYCRDFFQIMFTEWIENNQLPLLGANNAALQREKELESGVFSEKKQVRFYFATLIAW